MKKEEQTFTLSYVSYEEVLNEIRKLQTTKTTQQNDIPTKIVCLIFSKKHKFLY